MQATANVSARDHPVDVRMQKAELLPEVPIIEDQGEYYKQRGALL